MARRIICEMDRKAGRRAEPLSSLKLRVAHGSLFPYLVLGSEEFRGLSESVRLTIADGLIGEVLSLRATRQRIDKGFDPEECGYSPDEFDALPSAQQSEIMGDWVTMIEVESDFRHNPIVREAARLSSELQATGWGMTFLNDEELDRAKWVWMQSDVTSRRYERPRRKCACRISKRHSVGSQFTWHERSGTFWRWSNCAYAVIKRPKQRVPTRRLEATLRATPFHPGLLTRTALSLGEEERSSPNTAATAGNG